MSVLNRIKNTAKGAVQGAILGPMGSSFGAAKGLLGLDNPLDSPNAPPQPDFAAQARAQGMENRETALFNARLGNPWFSNPYGTQKTDWSGSMTGDPSIPFVTTELTPLGQQAWDSQQRLSAQMGTAAEDSLGRVNQAFANPFDPNDINALQDRAQSSIMNRLNPILNQREQALRTQLANQGLAPGSEAYTNAMRDFNNARNDAESQAVMQAINLQPQLLGTALTMRNQPLNEFNALRTGAQVQAPQFQGYQGATAQASPLFQAGQLASDFQMDLYNADMASRNALLSGLFSLGAAGLRGGLGG